MGYQPNRRDKVVVWLSNQLMRLATKEYRALLSEFILRGVKAKEAEDMAYEDMRNYCPPGARPLPIDNPEDHEHP